MAQHLNTMSKIRALWDISNLCITSAYDLLIYPLNSCRQKNTLVDMVVCTQQIYQKSTWTRLMTMTVLWLRLRGMWHDHEAKLVIGIKSIFSSKHTSCGCKLSLKNVPATFCSVFMRKYICATYTWCLLTGRFLIICN